MSISCHIGEKWKFKVLTFSGITQNSNYRQMGHVFEEVGDEISKCSKDISEYHGASAYLGCGPYRLYCHTASP